MRTIYKYPLWSPHPADLVCIPLPDGAQVLCVQTQNDMPMLWAIVDPEKTKVKRAFRVYGTGHPLQGFERVDTYIGTFQLLKNYLVFHVFEVPPPEEKP